MISQAEDVDAQSLRRQGWSISAIARHLGRHRQSIRRHLNGVHVTGQRPEPPRFGGGSIRPARSSPGWSSAGSSPVRTRRAEGSPFRECSRIVLNQWTQISVTIELELEFVRSGTGLQGGRIRSCCRPRSTHPGSCRTSPFPGFRASITTEAVHHVKQPELHGRVHSSHTSGRGKYMDSRLTTLAVGNGFAPLQLEATEGSSHGGSDGVRVRGPCFDVGHTQVRTLTSTWARAFGLSQLRRTPVSPKACEAGLRPRRRRAPCRG